MIYACRPNQRLFRESIPILSAGASITIIFPAAFVTLPTTALDALAPRARARIVAAGPFHNLLLWLLLASAARSGLDSALWSFGYKDVSSMGRAVINVDTVSLQAPQPYPLTMIDRNHHCTVI